MELLGNQCGHLHINVYHKSSTVSNSFYQFFSTEKKGIGRELEIRMSVYRFFV